MSFPPQKLPRRHAQRKTLYHGRTRTPSLGLSESQHSQGLKPLANKKQKSPTSNVNGSSLVSGSDSNSCSDSGSESESDSGYSSTHSLGSEAEHYRKLNAKFVAAGPNLAEPGETTEKSMAREERKWKL